MFGKVLIIAINEYGGRNSLRGCLNDAEDLYETLVQAAGYDPRRIRYLANDRATAQGIREGLAWLSDAPSAFCSYSGHGSLTANRRPALVSVDLHFLADQEIAACLGRNPALLIYDCCHSGSTPGAALEDSLRATNGAEENAAGYCRARYLHNPDLPLVATPDRGPGDAKSRALATDLHLTSSNLVYLSGCRDDETAKEVSIEGQCRGILSYNLCRLLRENRALPLKMLWNEASEAIQTHLEQAGMIQRVGEQHPQLWCHESRLEKAFTEVLA